MPIRRGKFAREHGARKAAKIISRNFAKLKQRQDKQQEQLDDVCECANSLCEVGIELINRNERQDKRIERAERNLDRATDTLSDEIDRLNSRIMGVAVSLVVFGLLLTIALVVIWSKFNG